VRLEIVDQMVESGKVPDRPEVELLEAQAAEEAIKQRVTLLEAAAVAVSQRSDEAVRRHHGEAFAVLDAELREVMETVRGLGDVPSTAAEAIERDEVDAYRTAQEAMAQYGTIRGAWARLFKMTGEQAPQATQVLQWVRPQAVLDGWHPPTAARMDPDGARDQDGAYVAGKSWPGWTAAPVGGAWPCTAGAEWDWLRWGSALDCLWCPTPSQLRQAVVEVADGVQEALLRERPGLGDGRREPSARELAARAAAAADEREARSRRLPLVGPR
jgi:hypothetical protein